MYNFLKENYLEYDYNSITMPLFYHDEFTLSSNLVLLLKIERLLKF